MSHEMGHYVLGHVAVSMLMTAIAIPALEREAVGLVLLVARPSVEQRSVDQSEGSAEDEVYADRFAPGAAPD